MHGSEAVRPDNHRHRGFHVGESLPLLEGRRERNVKELGEEEVDDVGGRDQFGVACEGGAGDPPSLQMEGRER